ncbi:proton-dependent oligopeptide transport family protein [Corchorus olitorius]|uniref:Proton-dependent oligopeptide transport family protein n=1 Tax=Corchorus olitorius TaxID=93759 RepID=A0A1R3KQZ3_9ROSI|nr:proton-dependent oligopeptide transport family protein [Corchorus olitorius]
MTRFVSVQEGSGRSNHFLRQDLLGVVVLTYFSFHISIPLSLLCDLWPVEGKALARPSSDHITQKRLQCDSVPKFLLLSISSMANSNTTDPNPFQVFFYRYYGAVARVQADPKCYGVPIVVPCPGVVDAA